MDWKNPLRYPLALALGLLLAACSDKLDPALPTPAANIGDTFALTTDGKLVTFNRANGAVVTNQSLTGAQAGDTLIAIAVRPAGTPAGQLYVLGSGGRLYTANIATGALTLKSTLAADPADTTSPFAGLAGTAFAIDFNPVPDRLRVVSNSGQNLRINVDSGLVTTDADLSIAGATANGVTAIAYTNNFAAACRATLFYVDTTADRLLTATDPNGGVLTAVGALGVDATAVGGVEVATDVSGANSAVAVLTVGTTQSVYTINLTTGAVTANGALAGLSGPVRSITIDAQGATPTQAVGELLALTDAGTLVSVQSGAPQKTCTATPISGLAAGESLLGIDLRPSDGAVYGLGSTGRVYTLNPTSGAAALKSTLAADPADSTAPFTTLDGTDFAVDVNPVPDRLRVISNTGQNLRINMDTGATTTDTPINPTPVAVSAGGYTNAIAGVGTTTLYTLDPTLDRLAVQGQTSGNPNNGDQLAVGPLGLDVATTGGFDINGRTGQAFAAMSVGAATTSNLYSINLTTGAATQVNTIAGNSRVRGLTFTAAPTATLYGITENNQLVSFRTTTPGTLLATVPVTGLQGGENIIGFDRRPANGTFYALTDAGRLYTVTTAGAATLGQTLIADAADTTAPFTTLVGTAFGVDFNPVPDRLRVISNSEQNLRINVDTGATTTDGALARLASFAVSAAAYTNNFAGATATTLYVIDTANDRLQTQVPPNAGTLNDVGALGIDATAVNAFEIVGPDTAVAVLATATGNGLYTINLTTGAATLVGAVAAAADATDTVSGLTAVPSATTPAADSTLIALVNGTTLARFARNAPATTLGTVAVTGLQAGETLVGIDYRPANTTLYGVGSTGQLYTIAADTGVATQVGAQFTLTGTNFGVDVNPVADRLRIVSDTGANLRVNLDTGAVAAIDTDLNLPVPDAVAAAYARNVAGTTTTTLYVLDLVSNTLQIQNPPNNGTLVIVGRLDPTATFTAGTFDIAGADDGFALAVLTPTGATQSTLYRVNLRTGALTSIGTVGPAGTQALRAFTIDVR